MMHDRQNGAATQHSAARWGIRIGLAGLACVLAMTSITDTLANVLVKVNPALAHTLAPNDGVITAEYAKASFERSPGSGLDSEPARLARLALTQDATAVEALSVLGLQAQMRNEVGDARSIFRYSRELSRRELRPQIWAIEEAVMRGDVNGALDEYDIALRTSKNAQDLLFPVLASAIAQPTVRRELLKLAADGPVWVEDFVDFVARRNIDPSAAAQFYREGEAIKLPVDDGDRAIVVNSLLARNNATEAWDYYKSFRPEAERERSRDPSFAGESSPTAFDWVTINDRGVSASIDRGAQGGTLFFSAPSTVGGAVLRQVQLLPPGTYRLTGRSTGIMQPARSLPYWELNCRGGARLGRLEVPSSTDDSGQFGGTFNVPANCPVQSLTLIIRSSNDIYGVSGQFDEARMLPVE